MRNGHPFLVAGSIAALLLAAACGSNVTVFDGNKASGGAGGQGGNTTPTNTPSTTSSSTGGSTATGTAGAGGMPECTTNEECAVDTPCIESHCDAGKCVHNPSPKGTLCSDDGTTVCDGEGNCVLSNGMACGGPDDCLSGLCVDGVCCDSLCDGACESCSVPASEGSCTPQPAGTDPDGECAPGVCDSNQLCATGSHVFSASYGNSSGQLALDVATDSANSIVLTGYFQGTINLGGSTLSAAGNLRDAFVAKLNPQGGHLWSKRFGDNSSERSWEVEIDASGNIILAGYFYGNVDFGGGPLISAGGQDIFLVKLNPQGGHIWSKRFGGVDEQLVRSLDVAPNGDILIGGFFESGLDFGTTNLVSAGHWDAFLAKLDKDGVVQFAKGYGDSEDQRVYGVSFDSGGNIVVTGRHFGTIDLGGGPLTSVTERDAYVAKLDPMGSHIWSQAYSGSGNQLSWALAVDAKDNIAVVGYTEGAVDFGGGVLTSAGGEDIFVAKLDSAGTHQWSKLVGAGQDQQPQDVVFDSKGNILLTGFIESSADFGGGQLSSAGQEDAFVAKLTGAGEHLWSYRYGSGGAETGHGLTVDNNDDVVVVGYHSSTVNFGGAALSSAGSYDAFIAKLSY